LLENIATNLFTLLTTPPVVIPCFLRMVDNGDVDDEVFVTSSSLGAASGHGTVLAIGVGDWGIRWFSNLDEFVV